VPFANGRWKLDGDTVLIDYTAVTSRANSESPWTLRLDGERLSGSGRNKTKNFTYDIDLRRAR